MKTIKFWLILALVLLSTVVGAAADETLPPAEYGHRLSQEEALAGWISLFDGQSDFGWNNADVQDGLLSAGVTTSRFGNYELRAKVERGGQLVLAGKKSVVDQGALSIVHEGRPGPIELSGRLAVRSLAIRPLKLEPIFNGNDLSGWQRVDRAGAPPARRTDWRLEKGSLFATGGPGALEHQGLYGDLVLQITVRTLAPHTNGGLFFRSQPGLFMMGYEAQLHNRCEEGDPGKPSHYSTGAIDDRQMARRLVSRDGEPFLMTVVADGPHIATWVNGYQMTDWTDDRPPRENPREGLRTEPGTIQLQAHDPETVIEFQEIAVAALEERE